MGLRAGEFTVCADRWGVRLGAEEVDMAETSGGVMVRERGWRWEVEEMGRD